MRGLIPATLLLLIYLPVFSVEDPLPGDRGHRAALEELSWIRCGGPPGGLGYDVRISPRDPNLMFVTDAFAGVFRSQDGGATWTPSNQGITTRTGLSADSIPVFSLTIDPNDPRVIWVGTQNARGIFKSVDEGLTWTPKFNGIVEAGLSVRGFAVEPGNSDTVYAAGEISSFDWAGEIKIGREFDLTKGVVYKTTDGGENWTAVWRGDNLARYIWIDPSDHQIIYVSTGIFDREAANSDPVNEGNPGGVGIVKSTDGGATWAQVNSGLANLYVGTLFMHPEDPDTLLAGTGNNQYGVNSGVYLSEDGGSSWTQTLVGGGDNSVEFSTLDPEIAYAADANAVYRSEDGGKTWQKRTGGPTGWGPKGIRAGFPIDIQVDPRDSQRIFANNYGGGNFLSEDGGRTWIDSSDGYTGAQVRDIAVGPRFGGEVYTAARSGLFGSSDGGVEWEGWNYSPFADLEWTALAVDPSDGEHLLAASNFQGAVLETYDRGRNWTRRLEPPAENVGWKAIVFAPSNPKLVYAGTAAFQSAGQFSYDLAAGGLYASTDGGQTWAERNDDGFDESAILAIAVHPGDPMTLFVATATAGLWKSEDAGLNWRRLENGLPAQERALSVAVAAHDPALVFSGFEGRAVYRSRDGGETWSLAATGMNPQAVISDIVPDPTRPGTVYASDRRSGVLHSMDSGDSWIPLDNNLSHRDVNALALSADGRHLYAGTEGGGVFRLDLDGIPPEPTAHFAFMAQFGDGDGFTSDIVLTNPSTGLTVTGGLRLFDDDGQPIDRIPSIASPAGPDSNGPVQAPFSIAPLGTLVLSTEGREELVAGAAVVHSSSRLGAAIRFQIPDIGIAGVGESVPLSHLLIPVRYLQDELSTGLAIQNPEPIGVRFTAYLRGPDGSVQSDPVNRSLAPMGHMAEFIEQIFSEAIEGDFLGTVEVVVEEGLVTATAMELGRTPGQFTTLPVTPVEESGEDDPSVHTFAQFGNGVGLQCDLVLVNPSQSRFVSFQAEVFDDEGQPIDVPLASSNGPSPAGTEWMIPPLGSLTLSTDGQGELVAGTLRLRTAAGRVAGVVRYHIDGRGITGVGESIALPGFIVPVRHTDGGINTGIAFHNPQGFPIQILLTLRDEDGQPLENGRTILEDFPANGHLAAFIDQLFPEAGTEGLIGTLAIQTEAGSVTGTALELGENAGEFTTLPVTRFHGLSSAFVPAAGQHRQPTLPFSAAASRRLGFRDSATVQGVVVQPDGDPIEGARVRVQAGSRVTLSGVDGRFELTLPAPGGPVNVTASAPGYFIGLNENCTPGDFVRIQLHPHPDKDDPNYRWLSSLGNTEESGCAECHSHGGSDLPYSLPVDEWLLDAHSASARNEHFLTMYTGTDVLGNRSPDRAYGHHPEYGRFPLPPDLNLPYFGPGFKLDYPNQDGNCAACHTPAAAVNHPYQTDPRGLTGKDAEGIPCDFCHKVWGVRLDPLSGLPFRDRPGVLSFEFRRPPPGTQFFAGPFDDVAPGEDVYSPVYQESRFCAPCHHGVFWGVTVYNSFGEWLSSPYSDPEKGQSCQDCHMPHTGAFYFARPEKGGRLRNPSSIAGHYMPGAADKSLLEEALELSSRARLEGGRLTVDVSVTNDSTGHHVPTGSPLRHVMLLIEARDAQGRTLQQLEGSRLPVWAGIGAPSQGRYGGLAGEVYAKVLMEEWTEIMPAASYWNLTRLVSDSRIGAKEQRQSRYVFDASLSDLAIVDVRLLFRRAYIELMEQKGWSKPDILMDWQQLRVGALRPEARGTDSAPDD